MSAALPTGKDHAREIREVIGAANITMFGAEPVKHLGVGFVVALDGEDADSHRKSTRRLIPGAHPTAGAIRFPLGFRGVVTMSRRHPKRHQPRVCSRSFSSS